MNKFKAIPTPIEGLVIIEPTVFGDQRGFFMETYARRDFVELGIPEVFVQDNHSKSRKGVLRGMHFQACNPQGKLIRVTAGAVLDVAVDLRHESPTFGSWESTVLSAENKRQFYVPPRFAHAFLTLEDETEFQYKCTEYYDPDSDGGIFWNDPALGIEWDFKKWGLAPEQIVTSDKDRNLPLFGSINWRTIFR